ncbi:MAG: KR domain-containing protein, partial [Sphingobacteriales bacterium]
IHSAGVLRDAYVRNKTLAEMSAVFAPKVYGTVYLDEATQDEPLDFFLLFSSLAALAGNAGQSDYSFANHFMDSFARQRELRQQRGERFGKTLSLNWSLWADGGMQLDEQTLLFFRKNLGINPLSIDIGLDTFIKGLGSHKASFAVIDGVQDKIERAWGLRKDEVKPSATTAIQPAQTAQTVQTTQGVPQAVAAVSAPSVGDAAQDGGDDLAVLVQQKLSAIVMDFLKLTPDEVDLDTILLDLGYDSIGLTTFANAVNDTYGLDVTPVLFFEYPNIREIAQFIATEHAAEVLAVHQPAGRSQAAAPVTTTGMATSSAAMVEQPPALAISKGWSPATAQAPVATQTLHTTGGSFSPQRRFVERPIAVVGMSGVMPQSDDLDEFWENLKNAEDTMVTLIPKDRWSWEDYYGDPLTEENKTKSKWGGFMREVDKFDPLFWGISPREAEMMDPQQRIFLETVWKAVEDSGQKVSDLAGTKTGLFVGAATRDYIDLMGALDIELDGYSASGTSHAILANRVSFLLGLHGPSAPLDTACSSSLVALHRAIESIHTGSSDMAIVGGIQVMLTPAAFISFGAAGMLAADGKCKTFDKKADGYVRG